MRETLEKGLTETYRASSSQDLGNQRRTDRGGPRAQRGGA
jgi:hypothetical protein